MKKLAILISGGGTNMQSVIDACESGNISGEVALVISSNHEAGGITRAKKHGIDCYVCALKDFATREERDKKILEFLNEYNVDFVVLAGYLGIMSEEIVEKYTRRIINIHPALLPKYGGKNFHGANVHNAVIEAGERESGATVHYVDKGIDTGEIIAQKKVEVKPTDTAEDLAKRVLAIEHKLLVDVLSELCK